MEAERTRRKSTKLSWLLRHGAGEVGLRMDAAGWAPVEDVLRQLRMSRAHLEDVVLGNNKTRFQIEEGKIRASQGHSLETMPVELHALEASWDLYQGRDIIWHGTNPKALDGIAREGIVAGRRTHVHLAAAIDSKVGKRTNVPVMLEISVRRLRAEGHEVFESPNGVILARYVPVSCIVGLRTMSHNARKQHQRLCSLFSW